MNDNKEKLVQEKKEPVEQTKTKEELLKEKLEELRKRDPFIYR
jgi:hypothetical protein